MVVAQQVELRHTIYNWSLLHLSVTLFISSVENQVCVENVILVHSYKIQSFLGVVELHLFIFIFWYHKMINAEYEVKYECFLLVFSISSLDTSLNSLDTGDLTRLHATAFSSYCKYLAANILFHYREKTNQFLHFFYQQLYIKIR